MSPVIQSSVIRVRGGLSRDNSAVIDSAITSSSKIAALRTSDTITENPNDGHFVGPKTASRDNTQSVFPVFPWHNLPNVLTYARCTAIPVLIYLFYSTFTPNKCVYTSLLFAAASFTDWLDGFLARRWNATSAFGAFLDPVADKLIVSTALILLTGKVGCIVAIPSTIILAREIAVSSLREWMAERGKRDSVKVGMQGKVKTFATMVSLAVLLMIPDDVMDKVGKCQSVKEVMNLCVINDGNWGSSIFIGLTLLYLSAVVTVTSGSVYFRSATPAFLEKE